MAQFSVVVLTAVPTAHGAEGAGALVKVDGRESVLRTVDLFVNRDGVKQIHLFVADDQFEEAKRKFGGHLSFSGAKMFSAGRGWMDQLGVAADKISDECSHVLVHDAARPVVAYTDLEALMAEADKHPVVVMTTAIRTGVVELEDSGKPMSVRSGQKFQQLVTPWAFRKDKFLEMVKNRREPVASEIWLLRSSSLNIRVTTATDATLAKLMLGMLPKPKVRGPDNPFEEAQW
jgi:2-C-methyl-D-erythritol 4-phosphate cytidylyltransferase